MKDSELIWLTVPHQMPPAAVWYENKDKLVQALHEHEVPEDLQYSEELEDFGDLESVASMKYNSTRIIDEDEYTEMRANEFVQLGHHQKSKAIKQIEECAEVLGWEASA